MNDAQQHLARRHRFKLVAGLLVGTVVAAVSVLTGTTLPLVVAAVAFLAWRFERRWARPARALRLYFKNPDADPAELDRVIASGGLAGIVPDVQRLARR